jgi:hypothetical protein
MIVHTDNIIQNAGLGSIQKVKNIGYITRMNMTSYETDSILL